MDWRSKFDAGLNYQAFLEAHGTPQHRERWQAMYARTLLTADQSALLRGFVRQINVLCLAGAWCGDCVNQCPILQRFAEATDKISLRFIDRDVHADVQKGLSICGGSRVPVVVFLSEDFNECSRFGDRTLSKYRDMAATLTGAACSSGVAGSDGGMAASIISEWLNEFERVQLMLRVSPRLRERHGD